jgi:hypothetical protein
MTEPTKRPKSVSCLVTAMAKHVDKNVECPYYRKDDGLRLICEGITRDMETINLVFPDRESLLYYRRNKCSRCWKECAIKKLIDKKWNYEE